MTFNERASEILAAAKVGFLLGSGGGMLMAIFAAVDLTSSVMIAPVAIVLACLTAMSHYWKTRQAKIAASQSQVARRRFNALEQRIAETQGLIQLSGTAMPYPLAFGGDYALTADAAAVLARQVALWRPRVVVELGSGVSTILVGKLLQDLGRGKIYSLDHDAKWADETRKHIAAAGLQDYAQILDAPLIEQQVQGQTFKWYKMPVMIESVESVDLLIVDGPPQRIDPKGLPRYPALPKLLPKLSETAVIFIDDAKRYPEQEMVQRWLEKYPGWQAKHLDTVPGTCLLWRSANA